jgi:hypothetical protein
MLPVFQMSALRVFLRDKLGFSCTDVGGGWLILDLPEADMGCHPADKADGAPSGTHDISFFCDNIERTVAELKARGVEFTGPIIDQGYGLVTHFKVPGNFELQLYQPRYTKKARRNTTEGAEAIEAVLRPKRLPVGWGVSCESLSRASLRNWTESPDGCR